MKRYCLVMTVLLAIGPLLAAEKTPSIAFESLSKDFGKVTEGETLKHVFKFSNKGTVTLDNLKAEGS